MINPRFYFKPWYNNSWALVIGINNYKNVSHLSYAVNDAKEFADVLHSKLNFPKENITYLHDEEATKENILFNYCDLANKVHIDDRVIFYFAGHGDTKSSLFGESGYLIPYDANSSTSTYISWDYLTKESQLIQAKHIFFIMDACYGGLALNRNTQSGSVRFLKDMLLRLSRQVLTAGKADETVSDSGGPLPKHSIFTGHLLEGLLGKAATKEKIITASGLMAYVYEKVANDNKSKQTPHYGHFDGDGDVILYAPQLADFKKCNDKSQQDIIFAIPYAGENDFPVNTNEKIKKCKSLLSQESKTIELHDFAVDELKRFLSITNEDSFIIEKTIPKDNFIEQVSKYEKACIDISAISTCIAYWGKQNHLQILQKIFSRATDRLSNSDYLRWYPLIIQMYFSGIAAIYGNRYDSLATVFNSPVNIKTNINTGLFLGSVGKAVIELTEHEYFKNLPGHEKDYTPMSDYLLKILQPKLDDILFIGKGYEDYFDEFEILFALGVADYRNQYSQGISGPVGRFGWKTRSPINNPFKKLFENAKSQNEDWPPLKAGLFGGDFERFNSVASGYERFIQQIAWY